MKILSDETDDYDLDTQAELREFVIPEEVRLGFNLFAARRTRQLVITA